MMTHEQAKDFLAVFALDAVDGDERLSLVQHLDECPRCRSELDGLRDVSAAMGNIVEPASEELWARIAEHLYDEFGEGTAPPIRVLEMSDPKVTDLSTYRSAPSRRSRAILSSLVAAAAVLVGVLGWNLAAADNRVTHLQSAIGAASKNAVLSALATPGHVNVTLSGAHASKVAQFVLLPDGQGYLVKSAMSALKPNRTYQLWGIIGGKPISIGLMGSSPSNVIFTVAGRKKPSALAVTVEPSGGSVVPTTPIIASGPV